MKKWLLISAAIATIGSIYIFIPAKLIISKTIIGNCTLSTADRCFANISKWVEWWPKNAGVSSTGFAHDTTLTYRGCTYKITRLFYNNAQVSIRFADDSGISSNVRLAPLNGDSILIGWECSLATGSNPFKKLIRFRHAGEIRKNMDSILGSFKSFIEDNKNIYGADFHRTMSNDSTLLTMNFLTGAYPGTPEIYGLIDSLKKYIAGQGGREINYPMLKVTKINDSQYRTMVAISVDKRLPGNARIIARNFVPWKMLEGEVHGGVYTIEKAFEQLEKYKNDHNNTIMALPFESLITDRSKEQDTSKWITKICAPIG